MNATDFSHRFRRWPTLAAALLVIGATGLSGCAVGPDFKPEAPVAPADFASWHGGAADLALPLQAQRATTNVISWAAFQDETLADLQARALAANHDVQGALLRLAQSRSQRQATAAAGAPQVNLDASALRQRPSEDGTTARTIDVLRPVNRNELIEALSEPFNLFQAGFDASWELDLWGRVRRAVESADAQLTGSEAALAQVRLSIQAEVARRYFELRAAQRRIELARADIAAAAETLALVKVRADGGLTTDLDVTRQAAQLADLRARLPQLLAQEAQAMNQITLLTGERPGALNALLAARPARMAMAQLPDLSLGLPSEVALRRPDVQRAQAQLHAATASIGVAVADLYPRITIGAGFGYESTTGGKFGEWGSRQWQIGPTLQLPIFDAGRRRSVVALRQLQQQEAAVAYQQTVLKAWQEIDDALSAYAAERLRNRELGLRETNSRNAYELARVRYDNGLTDFLVPLDAQRTLIQAQREQADSNARLATDLVAIAKALAAASSS